MATMTLTPYQPSRTPAAIKKLLENPQPDARTLDEAAARWIEALGSAPRCADECITTYTAQAKCALCTRNRRCTLVLDGFKGVVNDGNALVCSPCIDEWL